MSTRQDLRLDLIGLTVEKLTIVEFHKINEKGHTLWIAECECGNTKIVLGKDFKRGKGGKKCDECHLKEKSNRAKIHGDSYSKLYKIWDGMKKRCNDKNNKNYGKRNITYDSTWDNYKNFKKDMWYFFTKAILCDKININDITIERKDVNGNYCKENCTFIPMNKQQENRTTVRMFRATSPEGKIYITRNAAKFAKNFFEDVNQRHQINKCLRGERKYYQWWSFERI